MNVRRWGKRGINYRVSYEKMKGQKREHFPLPALDGGRPFEPPIGELLTGSRNVARLLIKFPA